MRLRIILAIGIIVFLIVFFLVPIAGGQERVARPDADHPFTPLCDPAGAPTGDPALKAGLVPIPAEYDILRDVAYPVRAGTGGGDMAEYEPNNHPGYANYAQDIPFSCSGTISGVGDIDWLRMAITTGEHLQINAHSRIGMLTSPLNPILAVYRSDGTLIALNDDIDWPTNLNAQINITATYTGEAFIAVTSAVPAGGPAYTYLIEVWPTLSPIFTPASIETEPNDVAALADPIALPGAKVGLIATSGDIDMSYFDAPAGATVVVDVHAQVYGTPLDPAIEIYDQNGFMLLPCDDVDGKDPRFNLVLPQTGRYFLKLTDHSNTGSMLHGYVVSVSLQDGTLAPHITKLKANPAGLLKKVTGYNFIPDGPQAVQVNGVTVPSVPSAANPTRVIKVKPPVAVPTNQSVTVVTGGGRRSNPVMLTAIL